MCKGRQLNQDTPYNLWILIWNVYGAKIEIKYNVKEMDFDLRSRILKIALKKNKSQFGNQVWIGKSLKIPVLPTLQKIFLKKGTYHLEFWL